MAIRRTAVGHALALGVALSAMNGAAQAVVRTWDGGAGTLNWNDANNWSPDGVPTLSDDVVIDVPASLVTITIAGTGASANTLSSNEKISASAALTIASASTVNGLVTTTSSIAHSGPVTFAGGLTLSGASLSGGGVTTIPVGATLTLNTGTNTIAKTINVAGSVDWATNQVNFQNSTLNILAGATMNAAGSALAQSVGTNALNNAGTINKSGGSSLIGFSLNNSGVVNVDSGTLTVNGGTNTGTYSVDAGATLVFDNNHTHGPASLVTGAGTINFTGGTNSFPAGTFAPSGTFNVNSGGSVVLNSAVQPSTIGSPIVGSLTQIADQTFPAVTVTGTLNGAGTFTFPDGLTLSGANFGGGGAATIPLGATLTFNTSTSSIAKTINVAGTVEWPSTQVNFQNSTLNILAGATMNAAGSALAQSAGTNAVNNAGTINKFGGSSLIGFPLNNSGVVNVDSGTLTVNGGTNTGIYSVDAGATLVFDNNHTHGPASLVTGAGTINFTGGQNAFPAGTFAPSGTFNVLSNGVVILNNAVPPATIGSPIVGSLTQNVSQTFPAVTVTGTLNGGSTFTFPDGLTLSGANFGGGGLATIPRGATIRFDTATNTIAKTIDVAGTVDWASNQVNFQSSTLNIQAGATMNAAGSALAQSSGTNVVNNAGTINKSGGSSTIGFALNNSGVVNVDSGTLGLNTGTNSGIYSVDAGATLAFNTNHTHSPTSLVTGAGTINFTGGASTFPAGTFAPSGTFNLTNGGAAVILNSAVSPSTIGSPIVGSLTQNVDQTFPAVTVTGTLNGGSNFTFPNGLTLTGANFGGGGVATIPVGATLTFSSATNTIAKTIDVAGTVDWLSNQVNFQSSTLNILPSGTMNAAGTALAQSSGVNVVNNAGTFNKSTGASTVGFTFNNSGTVNVAGGSLTANGNYTQTAGATIITGGSFTKSGGSVALQGGVLGGTGTLTGAVTQTGGSIAPGLSPGTFTVTSTLNQNATSTLDVELGGLAAGTQYDRLVVNGTATLAGTLRVTFVNGFHPHFGDSFTVLTAASRVGTFGSIDVVNYPDCVVIPQYTANSVILTVDSVAPTAACKDFTANLDASGHATIVASDVDNGSTDNCAIDTREVSPSSFSCANLGTNIVTLTITDFAQNVSTCQAIVTVKDVTAPVIVGFPTDAAFECASQIPPANTSLVTATDACGPISITHVGDAGNGGGGCAGSPLVVTRTYRATDGSGNFSEKSQKFTIIDLTAPQIVGFPSNQSLECAASVPAPNTSLVTAADNCGGAVFVQHVGDQSNGGSGCPGSPLVITRTYRASDACGNSVTQAQTFTVVDNTAPVFTVVPPDANVGCANAIPAPDVQALVATDNCSAVVITHQGDVSNGGLGCPSSPLVITRTYRATDTCGNFSDVTQTLTAIDTTAPEIVSGPTRDHAVADCGTAPLPDMRGTIVATDACGPVAIEQSPAPGTLLAVGDHLVSFTLTDPCGNETQASTTFSVLVDPCLADLDGDGIVSASDLGILLGAWGPCASCCANLNGDANVDASDLGILLGAWGPCPSGAPADDIGGAGKKGGLGSTSDPSIANRNRHRGTNTALAPNNGSGVASSGGDASIAATAPTAFGASIENGFAGVVNGSLTMTATYGESIEIDGDLILGPGDRLVVVIDAAALASNDDIDPDVPLFEVHGVAVLDGTLELRVIGDAPLDGTIDQIRQSLVQAPWLLGRFREVESSRELGAASIEIDWLSGTAWWTSIVTPAGAAP
ncbi:MAG: hypothetical protein U0572_09300 [Phycisphaerales bacterium]